MVLGLSDKTGREGITIINDNTISVSIDTVKPSKGWKFTKTVSRKPAAELVSNGKTNKSNDLRRLRLSQESHSL